jgi:hypothetical protein
MMTGEIHSPSTLSPKKQPPCTGDLWKVRALNVVLETIFPVSLSPSMQIPEQYLDWTKKASFSVIIHHSYNHKQFIFWDTETQNKPETIRIKPAVCPLNRKLGAPQSRSGHVDEERHLRICWETKRLPSFGRSLLFGWCLPFLIAVVKRLTSTSIATTIYSLEPLG